MSGSGKRSTRVRALARTPRARHHVDLVEAIGSATGSS